MQQSHPGARPGLGRPAQLLGARQPPVRLRHTGRIAGDPHECVSDDHEFSRRE
jgi:hypothetical protein